MKTIVITAHGRTDTNTTITLGNNLITTCKFGELHRGKHVDFKEMSVLTNASLLYEYVLNGDDKYDYNNQGTFIEAGDSIPDIILNPCNHTQSIKNWSWQQPYIVKHLGKKCAYHLQSLPANPCKVGFDDIQTVNWAKIRKSAEYLKDFTLINRTNIVEEYVNNTKYIYDININNHLCSLTSSNNGQVQIFDYELGPSQFGLSDDWHISDAIEDIATFCNKSDSPIDLVGVDAIVLKACLEF